jgi:myosin-crossreactive antigen
MIVIYILTSIPLLGLSPDGERQRKKGVLVWGGQNINFTTPKSTPVLRDKLRGLEVTTVL